MAAWLVTWRQKNPPDAMPNYANTAAVMCHYIALYTLTRHVLTG